MQQDGKIQRYIAKILAKSLMEKSELGCIFFNKCIKGGGELSRLTVYYALNAEWYACSYDVLLYFILL
jgi:hypothetical protein